MLGLEGMLALTLSGLAWRMGVLAVGVLRVAATAPVSLELTQAAKSNMKEIPGLGRLSSILLQRNQEGLKQIRQEC